jgi:hypothetical protein
LTIDSCSKPIVSALADPADPDADANVGADAGPEFAGLSIRDAAAADDSVAIIIISISI